jgi:hypothetical protein
LIIDAATGLKCKRKSSKMARRGLFGTVFGGVFFVQESKTIYLYATFLYHNQLNTTLNTAAVFVLASN